MLPARSRTIRGCYEPWKRRRPAGLDRPGGHDPSCERARATAHDRFSPHAAGSGNPSREADEDFRMDATKLKKLEDMARGGGRDKPRVESFVDLDAAKTRIEHTVDQ